MLRGSIIEIICDERTMSSIWQNENLLIGGEDSMIEIKREHEEPIILNVSTLKEIYLEGISFHRCFLNKLDFSGSVLTDVDFRSAEMNDAKFVSALFNRSRLIMAESRSACYDVCCFKDSLLFYCDFTESSFRGVDLSGGIVKDVTFRNCDLRGADLSCEGLETCNFEGAIYDDSTIWHEMYQRKVFCGRSQSGR